VAPPPVGIDVVQVGLDAIEPVRADHQQLRQVLLNLLTNSYQAMGGDGVLTIEARRNADGFDLAVSDTGAGMDEDTANHVFDAFFTRKAKGIGLGLAVTKRIVEAHGGTITARSQVGEGTTFVVSIPQTAVAEQVPS
jgi:signal transduction histidine kinase